MGFAREMTGIREANVGPFAPEEKNPCGRMSRPTETGAPSSGTGDVGRNAEKGK
jgi:hypothetical protein